MNQNVCEFVISDAYALLKVDELSKHRVNYLKQIRNIPASGTTCIVYKVGIKSLTAQTDRIRVFKKIYDKQLVLHQAKRAKTYAVT